MKEKLIPVVPVLDDLEPELLDTNDIESLYVRITSHIDDARQNIQRSIDTEIIKAYWLIGCEIVEEEQQGKSRAKYGKALLQSLANKLQAKYRRGFGMVSRAEESHLHPLLEPYLTVSRHTAPLIQPQEIPLIANE